MAKYNATLMNIYVSPVVEPDPTATTPDPQAAEGYTPAIADYTRVGNSTNLDIGRSRASIDMSDKDSGLEPDAVGGRRGGDISATVNLDDGGEPGQQIITDAYNSDRGEIWWLASQDTPETLEYWGRAIVTDASLSFPEEGPATQSFTGTIVGASQQAVSAAAV